MKINFLTIGSFKDIMKAMNPFLTKNAAAPKHTQFKHTMLGEEGTIKYIRTPPKSPVPQVKNLYLEE